MEMKLFVSARFACTGVLLRYLKLNQYMQLSKHIDASLLQHTSLVTTPQVSFDIL